jgi:hypothetical protein
MAYVVAALGFPTIPLQWAEDRAFGAAAILFSVFLVFASGIFCLMQPRGTPRRFDPVALALIAVILQMLLVHL